MRLKITALAEFLLTNVTRKPLPFVVRLQQMRPELAVMCETV